MIQDKEMGGVQLIAENGFESEFPHAFCLKFIPRFILLDQDGKIIDASAPRPMWIVENGFALSNELIDLIDKHMK